MDCYPISPLAIYDPMFTPLVTQGVAFLRVNSEGKLWVIFDQTPGSQVGACTNPTGTGTIAYNRTTPTILDSISLAANSILKINAIHAAGNVQAVISLDVISGATLVRRELVGIITESNPNWDPPLGSGFEVANTSVSPVTVQLRILSLRCDDSDSMAEGTGRIFGSIQ